jgi:hypothetical protein
VTRPEPEHRWNASRLGCRVEEAVVAVLVMSPCKAEDWANMAHEWPPQSAKRLDTTAGRSAPYIAPDCPLRAPLARQTVSTEHRTRRLAGMRCQARMSDTISRTEELLLAETCMMGMTPTRAMGRADGLAMSFG